MTTRIHLHGKSFAVQCPEPQDDAEAQHLEYCLILTVLGKFQATPKLVLPDGTTIYRDPNHQP